MSMMQAASAPSLPSLHFQRENLMDSISEIWRHQSFLGVDFKNDTLQIHCWADASIKVLRSSTFDFVQHNLGIQSNHCRFWDSTPLQLGDSLPKQKKSYRNRDISSVGMKGSMLSPNKSTSDNNNDPKSTSSFHASANENDFLSFDLLASTPNLLPPSSIAPDSTPLDLPPSTSSAWLLPSPPSKFLPSVTDPVASLASRPPSTCDFFWEGCPKSVPADLFLDGEICIGDSRCFDGRPTWKNSWY